MLSEPPSSAYLAYLAANGFAADGLIVVQNRVQAHWEREEGVTPLDPLRNWFRDRTLLAHDLFHVLTDYGTDELGEATLLAFTLAQLGGRSQALLTLGAALEVWRALGWRWLAYDFRAWRRGRRAAWLAALPWEELLPLRLDTVRRLAGLADAHAAHPGACCAARPAIPDSRRRSGRLLGDAAATTAMLDRLLHHGHVLKCGPKSWVGAIGEAPPRALKLSSSPRSWPGGERRAPGLGTGRGTSRRGRPPPKAREGAG